jgi:Zn-finger nucleic acid-binding protein
MLCPIDNVVCDPLQLQGLEIDVCPKCQGVWMEQDEVRKLVRYLSIPEYSNVDEILNNWEASEHLGTAPKDFWSEGKFQCPKEGAQMQKHYFAGSNIGVDQCHVCKGFWLEGGELQAVAKYVSKDVEQDEMGRVLIRLWPPINHPKTPLIYFVPEILLSIKNPIYGIAVLGRFFVNYLFDRVR